MDYFGSCFREQGIVHCCKSARWTRVASSPVPSECLFSFLKPQNLSTWALPFPLWCSWAWPTSSTYRTFSAHSSKPLHICSTNQLQRSPKWSAQIPPAPVPFSVPALGISSSLGCNNQTARQRQLKEIGFVLAHHSEEEIVRHDGKAWWPECDATIYTRCARRESVVLGSLFSPFLQSGTASHTVILPTFGQSPSSFQLFLRYTQQNIP